MGKYQCESIDLGDNKYVSFSMFSYNFRPGRKLSHSLISSNYATNVARISSKWQKSPESMVYNTIKPNQRKGDTYSIIVDYTTENKKAYDYKLYVFKTAYHQL